MYKNYYSSLGESVVGAPDQSHCVAIDARANVWPLVPPNTANSTMLESNPAHVRQETPNAIPA